MKSKLGPSILLVGSAVVIAALLFLFLPRRSHFPPLPNPNGYDVIVTEAAKVVRNSTGIKDMTSNQLAALVVTNEAAVRSIRKALILPSVVTVRMEEQWISSQVISLVNLKAAAQAMDAESHLASRRQDYTNSLAICLDQVQFSQAIMRGGVLINFLVGSACETMAMRRMTNLLSQLDSWQCKEAARSLVEIDDQRESFGEISARELEWQRTTYSAFIRFKEGFKKRILRQNNPFAAMSEALVGDPRKTYNSRTIEVRQLILKLAARAYQLEKGRSPSAASELVPAYLKEVPVNLHTGAPLELP